MMFARIVLDLFLRGMLVGLAFNGAIFGLAFLVVG